MPDGDACPEQDVDSIAAHAGILLLGQAADRMTAWAELAAQNTADPNARRKLRYAADFARGYWAVAHESRRPLNRPRWQVEAAAALLGVEAPPITEWETTLAEASIMLGVPVDDPMTLRVVRSGWRPRLPVLPVLAATERLLAEVDPDV